jgi:hypothetical protein
MRRRSVIRAQEDTTSQAGWMYADLFLALMVVFLATISFVPTFNGNQNLVQKNELGSAEFTYSQIYNKHLDILYDNFDSILIAQDVAQFLVREKLPPSTDIVFAQVIGAYDSKTEQPTVGINRAVAFSNRLDKALPDLLKHAASTMSSSKTINSNQVVLRLTFAQKVVVSKGR